MLSSSVVSSSCVILDYSPPGSSVHGIFHARILEWIAISSSEDHPNLEIEPTSPASPTLQVDSLPAEPSGHYSSLKFDRIHL